MHYCLELKKDNLPPDILVNGYEFYYEVKNDNGRYTEKKGDFYTALYALENDLCVYYRKKQKPAPTHEEIMTKWWLDSDGVWNKVIAYDRNKKAYFVIDIGTVSKRWFANKEPAVIPPEAL